MAIRNISLAFGEGTSVHGALDSYLRGIEYAEKDFKADGALELNDAIEKQVALLNRMLKEAQQRSEAAPPSFFANFYRHLKSHYDWRLVMARYEKWKRDVGGLNFDMLKDKQTLEVADFLKRKILHFTQKPSGREIRKVDLDKVVPHLPYGYELPKEFKNCCARFKRFILWVGDILKIDYEMYGNYLFMYYFDLTADERQAIIELDIMLDLIHQDMARLAAKASTEDRIRECIALLMTERYKGEPLFNLQSHWQAVYRILVDKGYCTDSDFDGFDVFIRRVMPEEVNKPYSKPSVKQISQTDFSKPFEEWTFDPTTSRTRRPFDRMVAVAQRFREILEENGL